MYNLVALHVTCFFVFYTGVVELGCDYKMSKWFMISSVRRRLNSILIRLMLSWLVLDWFISGWSFRIPYNYFHIRLTLGHWGSNPGTLPLCDSALMVPAVSLTLKSKSQISRIGLGFTKLGSKRQSHGSWLHGNHFEWCAGGGRVH